MPSSFCAKITYSLMKKITNFKEDLFMKNFILGVVVAMVIVVGMKFVAANFVTNVSEVRHNGEVIWQVER